MRILLVGEFSRLHNSLKEALTALGHEVILVADGDGFKNYPYDLFAGNRFCNTVLGKFSQRVAGKLFNLDLNLLERGIRFKRLLPKLKDFDVVQLINEAPIKTFPKLELKLLRQLKSQNKKLFLLSAGADYSSISYLMKRILPYSILDPYFENPEKREVDYRYMLRFLTSEHKKIHDYLFENANGVIATDLDYTYALNGNPKFLGLVPNPVNLSKIAFTPMQIDQKVTIFLGINRFTYYSKGINYFEQALDRIAIDFKDSVEIVIAENLPYSEYMKVYDKAHILLDQVHSTDQGYNALEAMAKGKVVFTGGGEAFMSEYKLPHRVVVDATPNVDAIYSELSHLIKNQKEIIDMGLRARKFIELQHDSVIIAKKYVEHWNNN